MKKRSKATISYTMSRIKGKNTGIEIELRKELTKRGLHYRHNTKYVFGHPDISFKRYKVAVFCDSEFWHGYHFEANEKQLKSHRDYWVPKIKHNITRDQDVNAELAKEGYLVLRFWGQDIDADVAKCADQIETALASRGYSKK
jgi:DNA mismatch endonuclease (patch repair protein)